MTTQLQQAVKFITDNPTLSFHHVATEFGVDVQELQDAYRESVYSKLFPQNEGEL